jgi:hypothetical protein
MRTSVRRWLAPFVVAFLAAGLMRGEQPAAPREKPPGPKDPLLDDEPPPQEDKARLAWLLQKRRDARRSAVETLETLIKGGKLAAFTSDLYLRACDASLHAELEVYQTPDERIRCCQEHLDRMKQFEEKIGAEYRRGSPEGPANFYAQAMACRFEAETFLLRERMAARGQSPKPIPPAPPRSTSPKATPGGGPPAFAQPRRLRFEDGEPSPQEDNAKLAWLMRKRRDALADCVEVLEVLVKGGKLAAYTSDLILGAYADLAAAELEVATTPAERIAVCEQYVKRARAFEDGIAADYKQGARAGVADLYMHATAYRLQAEIWLLRERKENGAKLAALLRERRDALANRVEFLEVLVKGGKLPAFTSDLVCDAYMDLADAAIELAEATGQPAAQRESWLHDRLARAKNFEAGLRALYVVGSKEGPRNFLATAKANRLECEIAIVRERLKTKPAPKQS